MKKGHLLVLFAFILSITLIGCAGSDGKNGANGIDGSTGSAGPVTNTNETCKVCHSSGKTADISVVHSVTTKPAVTNIVISSALGTADTMTFTVKSGSTAVTGLTKSNLRVYVADIVPANTTTLTTFVSTTSPVTSFPTPQLERWYSDSSTGTLTDLGSGNYSYEFTKDLADAGNHTDAPDFNLAHLQRVFFRVTATGLTSTYTGLNLNYANTIGLGDFTIPADGSTASASTVTRAIVSAKACTNCHGDPLQSAAHGGSYQSPQACNVCHTPFGNATGDEMQYMKFYQAAMIHQIHSAIDVAAFPTRILGAGYKDVTYPQDVKDCTTCHFSDGANTTDPDNWKTNPSKAICTTCHQTITFDGTSYTGLDGTAKTHTALTTCATCHTGTDAGSPDIVTVHKITAATKDTPEFDVTITATGNSASTYFKPGDVPVITVTLNVHGGAAVNPLFYTTAAGAKGTTTDTALSAASLKFYGPRTHSLPVLIPGSTTDPAYVAGTAPKQSTTLLGLASNDSTGFHITLQAIPTTMTSGTYIIAFEGADYGGVSDTDYVTSSSAFITVQIGTATVEKKVAGDGCLNCHGDTRMHLAGAHAHNIPFDTDACLSCHDQSGNHASPIANRVHAIHSANTTGELMNYTDGVLNATADLIDWSKVTYPQGSGETCATCHNSGGTSWKSMTNVSALACIGCHKGADSVNSTSNIDDHMIQNGSPYFD